jgi:fumarate reductase subunit D
MTGITAFQYVYATSSGFWLSALAAIGAAIGSIAIAILGFAKNPALRLIALVIFAVPAMIAGYAFVHGMTKHMIDSAIAINVLGGIGGIVISIAAVLNLNAVGSAALSR